MIQASNHSVVVAMDSSAKQGGGYLSQTGQRFLGVVEFPNGDLALDFLAETFPAAGVQLRGKLETAGPLDGLKGHLEVGEALVVGDASVG